MGYDDTIQAIINILASLPPPPRKSRKRVNSTGDGVIRISPVQIERNKMKKRIWSEEEKEKARELLKKHSYSTVGKMLHRSKNSVIGVLYRDKIKSGYIPPLDSKYARIRKYHRGFG